jgi:hypothetical protein
MLAERFSRIHAAAPIRFAALDPAHEQAIRNYLAIASRAQGLRSIHQSALGQDLPQLLGSHTEHAGNLLDELMQTNHHEPLGILNDLLHDHDLTPGVGGSGQLMRLIQQMHAHTLGAEGVHPAVLRGYGDAAVRQPWVSANIRHVLGSTGGPLDHMQFLLRSLTAGPHDLVSQSWKPIAQQLPELHNAVSPEVHASDMISMHDTVGGMLQQPEMANRSHLLGALHRGTQGALQYIHPLLWRQGEHGEFPQ